MTIHTNEDGFTLIEVLVSLMLMGMVMTLIYSTLGFSARALDRGVVTTANGENLVESQNLLRDMIAGSVPKRNSFKATSDRMSFLTRLSRNGSLPEIYHVDLSYEHEQLNLKWTAQDDRAEMGEVVLVSNLSEVTFEFGSEELYQDHQWQQSWQREDHPAFVKITIESEDFWPEMVIDLALTHTNECRYDPVSRECLYG